MAENNNWEQELNLAGVPLLGLVVPLPTGAYRVKYVGSVELEKDGKKTELTKKETPGAYLKRVCAEKGIDPNREGGPFPLLAKRISVGGDKEVKFDASVTRKEGQPKKLPSMYEDAATGIINNGTWEKNRKVLAEPMASPQHPKAKGYYGKDIGAQPKDRAEAIKVLGWAIREYTLNKQAAEMKQGWS